MDLAIVVMNKVPDRRNVRVCSEFCVSVIRFKAEIVLEIG
jgi:hypothetical protein